MTRRSKYGAVPCKVEGIRFASQKEAARYRELRLLERAGEIRDLVLQPTFPLMVHAQHPWMKRVLAATCIGRYVADFQYVRVSGGSVVIEDVKGVRTPLYRWKKKHVEAQHGITVTEV